MCGIVGVLRGHEGMAADMREVLHRMASRLQHRGPDGAGYMVSGSGQAGLAQTRLSIVDLAHGQQPLVNEDGSLILVVNGEIYDAACWRSKLEARGHRFATRSDSEVLLHLYEDQGLDAISELNGEFSFILWDQKRRRLLAGRDVFGVKPLFFTVHGRDLYLASEIKALFAVDAIPRSIAPTYFVGPMMGAFTPDATPFDGIKSLPPGSYLLCDEGSKPTVQHYYRPRFVTDHALDFASAKAECRRLLEQSVARRLVADVPVHVYLSGGVDSTSIAALMSQAGVKAQAFTISFPGSEMDELKAVRRTAASIGADLNVLECDADGLIEHLIPTIWSTEAPIGNLNSVAKFMLSGYVHRRGIKVCMTGEGADELFCGYANFKLEAILQLERGTPSQRRQAQDLWKKLCQREERSEGINWNRMSAAKARKTDPYYGYPSFYRSHVESMDRIVPRLLHPNLRAQDGRLPSHIMAESNPRQAFAGWEPLNITRALSMQVLAGYLIPYLGDRVEMANSLECRTPFMDRDLLQFMEQVPPRYLLDIETLREKHLLYEAMRDLLPESVYNGSKHPFVSPSWSQVLRRAKGRDLMQTLLQPREIDSTGIFNPSTVQWLHAAWRLAPDGSSQKKSMDLAMGGILSSQVLHRLFIMDPPAVTLLTDFRDMSVEGRSTADGRLATTLHSAEPFVDLPKSFAPSEPTEWQAFVLRHQKAGNLLFHLVSSLWFFGGPIWTLATGQWYGLGLFMLSGGLGALGHYLFRDGGVSVREATFQLSVPYFVLKMFTQILLRQYKQTTAQALKARQACAGRRHR